VAAAEPRGKIMASLVLRLTQNAVEIAVALLLLAMGAVIFNEAMRLGPGWGEQGPQAGFFPFVLTVAMTIGALVVLLQALFAPNRRPIFEVSQEIVDLLKVGIPVAVAVFAIRWLGIYITAGVYLAFFMAWYGKFRWWQALAGGILLPVIMFIILQRGFALPMPMSVFYRQGTLPF
jgi:putative tricarboxylic transport membrane protein